MWVLGNLISGLHACMAKLYPLSPLPSPVSCNLSESLHPSILVISCCLEACHRFALGGRGLYTNATSGSSRQPRSISATGAQEYIETVKEREKDWALRFSGVRRFSLLLLLINSLFHSTGKIFQCTQTQPGRTSGGCTSEDPGAGVCDLQNDPHHLHSLSLWTPISLQ